ncbi:hypothetical protein RQP46_007931 [Phenoliferia psychrophenolica]
MVHSVQVTTLFALAAALVVGRVQLRPDKCASVNPPGGLDPQNIPQFITFTADDAIESYTTEAVNHFLAQRKNPNGCAPKMTYFTSTNYSMVTDWYVAGNEIADHTMTHVCLSHMLFLVITGQNADKLDPHPTNRPNSSEILGNLKALNAFSGIPVSSIKGFRAPLLSYNADTLTQLHAADFVYDSSATSATPANDSNTDAYWPYTLDYGFANDCLQVTDVCQGQLKLPGLWEIPMYATFDEKGAAGIHLMDVWLDSTNPDDALAWMKETFLTHYNGNRQPFGLYTHPIHVAVGYPGVTDPISTRNMINQFLDWTQTFQDVWFVSNEQLLEWVKAPVTNDAIGNVTALQCKAPVVNDKICNGIPANEQGLLLNCPFIDFPFTTCYGCPVSPPTPQNPVPAQNTTIGVRSHISANCSTAFFDPVANKCLCTDATCAFQDNTGPITEPTGTPGGNASGTATGSVASATSHKGAASALWSTSSLALVGALVGGAVLAVVA